MLKEGGQEDAYIIKWDLDIFRLVRV